MSETQDNIRLYAEDDNHWWRLDSGDHQVMYDTIEQENADLKAKLAEANEAWQQRNNDACHLETDKQELQAKLDKAREAMKIADPCCVCWMRKHCIKGEPCDMKRIAIETLKELQ